MCAIVDVNIAHEVFGDNRPEAGEKFFDWVSNGVFRLVIGGELHEELYRRSTTRRWLLTSRRSEMIRFVKDSEVNALTEDIKRAQVCQSDDPHIIALAKISGARLLYSNDIDLHKDFRDKALIDQPRGRVYSTLRDKRFSDSHKKLLARTDLCS